MFNRAEKKKKAKSDIPSIDINNAIKISDRLGQIDKNTTLTDDDIQILRQGAQLIQLLVTIYGMWKKSKKRIGNLLKMVFGNRSEKLKDLGKNDPPSGTDGTFGDVPESSGPGTTSPPSSNDNNESPNNSNPTSNDSIALDQNGGDNNDDKEKKKRKGGGGKNAADDYTAAAEIECKLDDDKMPGKICPECNENKLFEVDPKKVIRLVGNAPVTAFKFILQQTRCVCGAFFTADVGDEFREIYNEDKYSPSALAAIMIIKYLMGSTFGKLEKIQAMAGVPLPASTQMNKIKIMGLPVIQSVMSVCKILAANAKALAFDDTRIRTLEKRETKKGEKTHNGHGTAVIADGFDNDENQVILFDFDVNKHAGEVICELLSKRDRDSLPLLISDGLPAYDKCKENGVDVNCNVHARRKVVEEDPKRETYVGYAVLECYKEIYTNDRYAKDNGLTELERMQYHQENSRDHFEKIKAVFDIIVGVDISIKIRHKFEIPDYLTFDEPNSDLYKTAEYFLDRYGPLTQVLNIPGVPLDTNHVERIIKSIILLRKNSLFFHNHFSARYSADILSLLETANHSQVNVFDYMDFLLSNKEKVMANPHNYLPWIYNKSDEEKQQYWADFEELKKSPSSYPEFSTAVDLHSSA